MTPLHNTLFKSLKFRIFLWLSFMLGVIVGLQFFLELQKTKTKTLDYVQSSTTTINKFLAQNIRGYIFNKDMENIKLLVDAIENKYIENILILSPDGQLYFSKKSTNLRKYPIDRLINYNDNDFISYSTFDLLGVNMGYMVVEANKVQYDLELKEQFIQLCVRASTVFLITLILSWFISNQISKPIDKMIRSLKKTPSSEPISFAKQRINEFYFLAHTIQTDRNALLDLNHNLESRIIEEVEKSKFIEKKLYESEKLASMGEMIGNIAHQWRQPLSTISTIASGVKLREEYGLMENYKFSDDMDNIVYQTKYLSSTIDDFRNFIKDSVNETHFDFNDAIHKTITIVSSALHNNQIKLILNLHDNYAMKGHQNELIQAFINIINNARDAIVENIVDEDLRYIFIDTKLKNDKFEILIYDSGNGLPNDIMPKIFEPYFTTKHQSVGTGIGLSMTHKIITARHKGSITVSNYEYEFASEHLKGAKFTIEFPMEEE